MTQSCFMLAYFSFVVLALGMIWQLLIAKPQKVMLESTKLLSAQLKPGVIVTTTSGLKGAVMFKFHYSIIIKTHEGELIEILTSTITHVKDDMLYE